MSYEKAEEFLNAAIGIDISFPCDKIREIGSAVRKIFLEQKPDWREQAKETILHYGS